MCASIAPSPTLAIDAKAKEMRRSGRDVVSFSVGEPDFVTPQYIRTAAHEALDMGLTKYTPAAGTLGLRRAICEKLRLDNGLEYSPSQVIVSNGAKFSIYAALAAIVNPGDEVIIPTPCWVSYPEIVRIVGGVPVLVQGDVKKGFVTEAEDLAPYVTERTKALILNSPNNPNGCIWSREQLAGIAEQDGNVAIGILHGEAGVKDSRYRPIPLQQIAQSGLDYLALGHVHTCSGVQLAGKTAYAYPGCPEGRGFDELGDKGFLAGEVDKGSVKLRFVPFAKRRYEIVTVDVTGREPLEAVCEALPQHTEADIYRVILTGERSGSVDTAAITDELSPRFYALEVRDRTTVCRDIWDGCGEDSLRGLFLQKMREKYDAAGENERQTIQQAVRFALSAMENRDM